MANHIAEVAKLLWVELGESFKISSDTRGVYQNYYRFTENNCLEMSDDGVEWGMTVTLTLRGILMGDIRIVKLPWKPRKGEKYYIPYISTQQKGMHVTYYWNNDHIDIEHYRMGLVCKTPEEAIAITMRMLDTVKELRKQ